MNSRLGLFSFCFIVLVIFEIIKILSTGKPPLDFLEMLLVAYVVTYISEWSKK